MAHATGSDYVSFGSLAEAQADPDGCVILEGDDGGQLYLVVHAKEVQCDEVTLSTLLRDLDAISWPANDDDMARVVYERRPVGTTVAGGMGGGVLAASAWIHPSLGSLGLADEVRAVLLGRQERLRAELRALRRD
jgi:hypothetical protein